MGIPEDRTDRRAAYLAAGAAAVSCVLLYLYVWLRVEPNLIYQQQCPVFLTSLRFLKRFLGRPGGPVEYVSDFLSQFTYYAWAGALVITVVTCLVCLCTRGLLRRMTDAPIHPSVYFFPAVLLLMLHGRYRYHMVTGTALLTALVFVNVYVRITWRGALPRLTAFLILSVIVYYAVGGMYVLYAALCGLYELLRRRRVVLGVLCLACAPALPCAFAIYSYDISTARAYVPLPPFREEVGFSFSAVPALAVALHLVVLLFFPSVSVWAALRRVPSAGAAPETPGAASLQTFTRRSLGLFLLTAALLLGASFDEGAKRRLQIDYYARHRQWELVLEKARRLPAELYDVYVMHEVNRALYHSGRLLDEMFSYPQRKGAPSILISPQQQSRTAYEKFAELAFELGHVNLAQHWGHQVLEFTGPRPHMLKLLAYTNIVKGRVQAADTFLGALSRNPLHSKWAERYRQRLGGESLTAPRRAQGPGLVEGAADGELRHLRSVMVNEDHTYGGLGRLTYKEILCQLLRGNKQNRMAFEYLTALYLLMKQLDQIIANVERLDDFGYSGIPRHYEEAISYYIGTHPDKPVDLRGRHISKETEERFHGFARDLTRYRNARGPEKQVLLNTLIRRWGNSYFYYAVFGFSEPAIGWRIRRPDVVTGATK